jgi:DNA-binding GntR family transcriptional regulator
MMEIVDIRRSLERLAIERWMANITDVDVEKAGELADELADEEDLGSWVQTNRDFHSVFHRATATNRLANILVSLESASGVFVAQAQRLHPEIRRRAVADHYGLLEACREQDVDAAYRIQFTHISLPLEASERGA